MSRRTYECSECGEEHRYEWQAALCCSVIQDDPLDDDNPRILRSEN